MGDDHEALIRAARVVHDLLPDRHAWSYWEAVPNERWERCVEIAKAVRAALRDTPAAPETGKTEGGDTHV